MRGRGGPGDAPGGQRVASPGDDGVQVAPGWGEVLEDVRRRPGRGRVAVLGRMGTGKSMLARWLGRALAATEPTGRLDADPGQASIGPPGTIALGREPGADDAPLGLRFVGAPSPARHLLSMAVGLEQLARRAEDLRLRRLVLDPPGFLDFPAGHSFHFHLVELLDPDHLIAVDGGSLAPVLEPLRRRGRPALHHLDPSPAVVERSREERRAYRAGRYRAALRGSRSRLLPKNLPLHGHVPDDDARWPGLLVGLLDRDGFLHRLGAAEGLDRGRLRVRARPYDAADVASVEVGTGRVDV